MLLFTTALSSAAEWNYYHHNSFIFLSISYWRAQENIWNTWFLCQRKCSVDLKTKRYNCSLHAYQDEYLEKILCSSLRKLKEQFPVASKGAQIDYQCLGGQEHICCVQVVWGAEKSLESSWIQCISQSWLLLVGWLSQLQSWISWTQAHLYSHFLVWKGHPLLHHNYYIQSSSCLTAEPSQGFNCRAGPVFMKFLKRARALLLKDVLTWGPTFIKPPRIVVLMAGDVSRSPATWLMDLSVLTDCEWGQSLRLFSCSCLRFTADTSQYFCVFTAFHSH